MEILQGDDGGGYGARGDDLAVGDCDVDAPAGIGCMMEGSGEVQVTGDLFG